MTSSPLRVGLIGCGRIVEEGHGPAYNALADSYAVVALADPSEQRRDLIGERFGVAAAQRHADYRDLLATSELDLVDIAVPHALHAETCIAAAQAGLPIVLEKPMATTLEEAEAIIAAVEVAGVPATLMHNYLHDAPVEAARAAVERGAIGEPFMYRSEWMGSAWYDGALGYDPAWRTRSAISGGGALIDNGYHALYAAEALMRSPISEVYARTGTFVHEQDVEDTAALLLTHASGAISMILAAWSARSAQRVHELHGSHGSIRIEGGPSGGDATLITDAGSTTLERPDPSAPGGFTAVLAAFARTLNTDAPPPYPLSEGLAILRVVRAAYESASTGRPVAVGG